MKYLLFLCLISAGLYAHISNDLYNAIKNSDERAVELSLRKDNLTANEKKSLATFANNIISKNKIYFKKICVKPTDKYWIGGLLMTLLIGGMSSAESFRHQEYRSFSISFLIMGLVTYFCVQPWRIGSAELYKKTFDQYHASLRILLMIESEIS